VKKLIQLCLIVVAAAAGQRIEAATYTNYLDESSNIIVQAYSTTEGKVHTRLGRALAALDKQSTSVAGDFGIFQWIANQLLPVSTTAGLEEISPALSNAFDSFVAEAVAQIDDLSTRLQAIPSYQNSRAASNQLVQAEHAVTASMEAATTQKAITSVRLAFVKIGLAEKLLAKLEAQTGFAPDTLIGITLTHREPGDTGTLTFVDGTNYVEDNQTGGTYTYTRTGLNTATLVVNETEDNGVTTVQLKFTSETTGRF
jgi:hypothetical protein